MREIRFRAWHKEGAYMMPVEEIDFENKLINKSGVWRWFNELVIMQFTGLKDKNGVEIFEKDIVKIRVDVAFNYIDVIGFVDWYEKKSEYAMFSKGEPWIPLSIEGEIEVIGNIYENPELLD